MKKKMVAYGLVAGLAVAMAGCGGTGGGAGQETTTAASDQGPAVLAGGKGDGKTAPVGSGKPLVVGTMASSLGLPVHQADIAGYFKDAGLDVKIEIFATGAPINEAMAAGDLDVAVSGMASVYALSTGMYTYIGDGVITTGGESIYARPDSPIAKAGANEKGVVGSKEVLKGVSILGPLSTTAHYQAIQYIESFGLTSDDFSMVSMDYSQAYQAFVTGKGDLLATKMPYTRQLEEAGYVKVCDMNKVSDSPIIDTIFAQNKVVKERRKDLELFLQCYYKACSDLMEDEGTRRKVAQSWYADEGIRYSQSDMDAEIQVKDYVTLDTVGSGKYKLGQFMVDIGGFYVDQDMIAKDDFPKIQASIDPSLIRDIKANQEK